jgi:hypothetical protein
VPEELKSWGWLASEDRAGSPGSTNEHEREVIAMARNGATASEIAAKFKTTTATIERKARALGISITGGRVPKVVTRDCHPAQGSATVSCLPLKARLASV